MGESRFKTSQGVRKYMNMHEYAERVESIRDKLYRSAVLYLGSASDAEEALDESACGSPRSSTPG